MRSSIYLVLSLVTCIIAHKHCFSLSSYYCRASTTACLSVAAFYLSLSLHSLVLHSVTTFLACLLTLSRSHPPPRNMHTSTPYRSLLFSIAGVYTITTCATATLFSVSSFFQAILRPTLVQSHLILICAHLTYNP